VTFDLVEDTSPSEKLVILALACQDCFAYSDNNRQDVVPVITQAITEPTRRAVRLIKNAVESLEARCIVRVYRYQRRIYYVQLYNDPAPAVLAGLEALQPYARWQLLFSLSPLEPLRERMERHTPPFAQVYEDCVQALNRLCDASEPIDLEGDDGSYTVYMLKKPRAVLQQWWMDFYANNRGARRALYYLQALGLLQKYPVPNPWNEELYNWFVVPGQVDYHQLAVVASGNFSYEAYLLAQHRRDAGLEV
jgi:hypothetical protein